MDKVELRNCLKTCTVQAAASGMLGDGHPASSLCHRFDGPRMGVAQAPPASGVARRSPPSPLAAYHPQRHLLSTAHRRRLALSAAGVAAVADRLPLLALL